MAKSTKTTGGNTRRASTQLKVASSGNGGGSRAGKEAATAASSGLTFNKREIASLQSNVKRMLEAGANINRLLGGEAAARSSQTRAA